MRSETLRYTNLSCARFLNMLLQPGIHIWLSFGQKRGEMEYEDRLSKLMWPTLETRRLFLSLVECYKIVLA